MYLLAAYPQTCISAYLLVLSCITPCPIGSLTIYWMVLRHPWSYTNIHFSLTPRNSTTCSQSIPSSIISNIYNILSVEEQGMSQSFSNNTNSLNTTVNNFSVADDRSDILAWLSPLEPRLRHQDIRDQRVEDVGEWLLQTEEFRSWCAGSGGDESDNAVLFCYGDPGVGKTYIR